MDTAWRKDFEMPSWLWDCLKELFKPLFGILGIILTKQIQSWYSKRKRRKRRRTPKLRPQTGQQ